MPDTSIMPPPAPTLLDRAGPKPAPEMREFGDALATRRLIYDNALAAARAIEPLHDERHTLRLTDVDWADPDRFTRRQRKEAVLTGGTLARRLQGTWELADNATGAVLERRRQVVARVPYLSSMGTFTHRGNEYAVVNQQRLLPGVFAREKANSELESHFNILPGEGLSHRYSLDPARGVFKINVGQASMPLLPLLQALGASDKEVRAAWGDALFASNYAHNDGSVVKKLATKLLRRADQEGDEGTTRQKVAEAFLRMKLNPEVTQRTLGKPYAAVDKDAILTATQKLLAVSRGEAEPDDRDHLAYQQFFGPEDLFAERIRRDHGRLRANLFRKVSTAGGLAGMPSGALTPQIEQVLIGSGLAQALEEVNPMEVFDKQSRVTRMGEGGIPGTESIPSEARSVQPSHLGFMDAWRTPESFAAGVDLNMARAARKGRDGRIYTQLLDHRTGQPVWKSPQELADAAIVTRDALRWDTKRIPVTKGGKLHYLTRNEVDYVVPHFESAFSPIGNLVPFKSADKGQRVAMASRMLTQALPLRDPEAPLVQSGTPESKGARSFEEEYAKHAGAIHADQGGRVEGLKDGVLRVRYDDGRSDDIELYENHPFNRKTLYHQTPLLKPGDTFRAGQPLVRSNYTDGTGTLALGVNARTAYAVWHGYNYEDASVISESLAKKFSSEHMYQHGLEVTDRHKLGKKPYINLFPGKFKRATLDLLDDEGVIKPGTEVQQGDPLILAARQRDHLENKVHKRKQPGFTDESVVWEHHDPGVVTDVVRGPHGPVVTVKSYAPMQVGDKLSGRHGDKGVVSLIVPDDQMPKDAAGQPFEAIINPNGLISRTNAGQKIENWLGKVAAKTGKPIKVPDFEDVEDLTAYAMAELKKHGLSDTEDIYHPEYGKIGGVSTGVRFLMKLQHQAEGKAQGRGGGSYDQDEAPAKGGPAGCFVAGTLVHCHGPFGGQGSVPIETLVETKCTAMVATRRLGDRKPYQRLVSDWFAHRVPRHNLVRLTLESGATITCTRGHEFVLADGTRRLAGALREGDDLMELFPKEGGHA